MKDRYCATCGRQLALPETPTPDPLEPPTAPLPAVGAGFTWHPFARHERPAPVALVVAIAAVLVVAFAGVAAAVILAVSKNDGVSPSLSAGGAQTTVTVISHGP